MKRTNQRNESSQIKTVFRSENSFLLPKPRKYSKGKTVGEFEVKSFEKEHEKPVPCSRKISLDKILYGMQWWERRSTLGSIE